MKENKLKKNKQVRYVCDDGLEQCKDCVVDGKLMCSLNIKDSIYFMVPVLAIWITWVVGFIDGYIQGKFDLIFLVIFSVIFIGYLIFFFQVWENKMLCSHCPYYAFEDEKYVKCYANYGIHKVWKYNPEPMSTSEKIQFLIAITFFAFPPIIIFLVFGLYLYFWISLIFTLSWLISMHFLSCSKCLNFSCPFNNVPKEMIDTYLKHNSVMREAWEKKGYVID